MRYVTLLLALLLTACAGAPGSGSHPVSTLPLHPPADPVESGTPESADPIWPQDADAALCELYLQVLEDLWQTDPGLNSDISVIGVDLSGACGLNEEACTAVAGQFGTLHDLPVVQSTWQQLADDGVIDTDNLMWEDGCLFTVSSEATEPGTSFAFRAEKWRSGLGAYFLSDCYALYKDGQWHINKDGARSAIA